jgi:dienelactone hydrolase
MAELGLAVVAVEYDQTNRVRFAQQLAAVHRYLATQPWADTNKIAWVGMSLGAQEMLGLLWSHSSSSSSSTQGADRGRGRERGPGGFLPPPALVVRIAGGWVPELAEKEAGLNAAEWGHPKFLILHGEADEVFPAADARRVAEALRARGLETEVRLFPGQSHNFGENRELLFRMVGEECLRFFKGSDALATYRSIGSFEAAAWPLWIYMLPALVWVGWWGASRRRARRIEQKETEEPLDLAGTRFTAALILPENGDAVERVPTGVERRAMGRRAVRLLAIVLALAATAETAAHLITPHFRVTPRTLRAARAWLVQRKELDDFDFLAAKPIWAGQRLKTLLTHVELANYNRTLVNWTVPDEIYRDYVLSPIITGEPGEELAWRRPLWESFYPRIRRELSLDRAAAIVARHLRERVTPASIAPRGAPAGLPSAGQSVTAWVRQVADERGFEGLYVAALRSAGIPARLGTNRCAEIFVDAAWKPAPRPMGDLGGRRGMGTVGDDVRSRAVQTRRRHGLLTSSPTERAKYPG